MHANVVMDNRTRGRLIEELQKALANIHKIVNVATNNRGRRKKRNQSKGGNCVT
jgi:hypothetical protein